MSDVRTISPQQTTTTFRPFNFAACIATSHHTTESSRRGSIPTRCSVRYFSSLCSGPQTETARAMDDDVRFGFAASTGMLLATLPTQQHTHSTHSLTHTHPPIRDSREHRRSELVVGPFRAVEVVGSRAISPKKKCIGCWLITRGHGKRATRERVENAFQLY